MPFSTMYWIVVEQPTDAVAILRTASMESRNLPTSDVNCLFGGKNLIDFTSVQKANSFINTQFIDIISITSVDFS